MHSVSYAVIHLSMLVLLDLKISILLIITQYLVGNVKENKMTMINNILKIFMFTSIDIFFSWSTHRNRQTIFPALFVYSKKLKKFLLQFQSKYYRKFSGSGMTAV